MKEKFLKYTSCQRKRNDVHPVIWICDCHRNWIHCFVIIDNNKLRFKSEQRELNQNDGKLFLNIRVNREKTSEKDHCALDFFNTTI